MAGEDFVKETARVAAGRPKGRSLGPLRGILPFLRPYRGRIALASLALIASSAATLALPQFARGLIDARGLSAAQAHGLADFYFAFVLAAGVLGLASAIRFYMVTWLGERVVADIRKAVFDNVLGLSPQFFEVTRTGDVRIDIRLVDVERCDCGLDEAGELTEHQVLVLHGVHELRGQEELVAVPVVGSDAADLPLCDVRGVGRRIDDRLEVLHETVVLRVEDGVDGGEADVLVAAPIAVHEVRVESRVRNIFT